MIEVIKAFVRLIGGVWGVYVRELSQSSLERHEFKVDLYVHLAVVHTTSFHADMVTARLKMLHCINRHPFRGTSVVLSLWRENQWVEIAEQSIP
jgi:hypothetical protein